jgi:hypothetical protein
MVSAEESTTSELVKMAITGMQKSREECSSPRGHLNLVLLPQTITSRSNALMISTLRNVYALRI